ncbi:hypothetical protein [Parageobacillus thermoglucosidasius]|uniref:hypothetical protein n=1 Tax=Parageobacillus thermoglucosidasius TaxID=1426 RepID=UPI00243301FB|nr:hypothetical protein [Parageobacillus thermoglucosidasius]MBY6269809.1 hypothetical protein [Parageobacillus thermoglucosidasius]
MAKVSQSMADLWQSLPFPHLFTTVFVVDIPAFAAAPVPFMPMIEKVDTKNREIIINLITIG